MKFIELLFEGKVEDFEEKFSKKFNQEQINRMIDNFKPKYLEWVGKTVDAVSFDKEFADILKYINRFDSISSNLSKTDIYQYKNLKELYDSINEFDNKTRRTYKAVQGGNVVYEDDRYFVVNPLTLDSSCYYGKGTKWCTASETNSQFTKYNEDGKLFYILDKKLKTDDPFYKVALLKKFDGDESWWDAVDKSFNKGWIIGTPELEKIRTEINNYLENQFSEQLKIWRDKESARKERQRLESIRERQRISALESEADERRLENEWDLNETDDDKALKAHALLEWLEYNDDVSVITPVETARLSELRMNLERLENEENQAEAQGLDTDEITDALEETREEIEELEQKIDVYNIVPVGDFYTMTEFEVINAGLEGRRYAVGDEDEMQSTAYQYVDNLIDDIGFSGFRQSFVEQYLDEDAIADEAREVYENDVRDNPESYLDESDRQLSYEQEEKIEILKMRIESTKKEIEKYEEMMETEQDEEVIENLETTIEDYKERIEEFEMDIEDIELDPEGEFPDDLIDEKVDDMVQDVKNNPKWFMEEMGMDYENYINREEFIQAVIDEDGYGMVNGYDGNYDEKTIKNQLFYVMRID